MLRLVIWIILLLGITAYSKTFKEENFRAVLVDF